MIVGGDIKPERQIYHLGSLLLDVLQNTNDKEVELLDLYEKVNQHQVITMSAFILAVDWLFLLGVVKNKKGYVVKCF